MLMGVRVSVVTSFRVGSTSPGSVARDGTWALVCDTLQSAHDSIEIAADDWEQNPRCWWDGLGSS